MRESLSFLREFIRRPSHIGAIAPSSRWLSQQIVQDKRLRLADTVVELGPGTGAITSAIQRTIAPSTTFFALEINKEFASNLRVRFPKLTVHHASADKLPHYLAHHRKSTADCVLSGLPWASLPLSVQEESINAVADSISPGGSFTTFAYLHATRLPRARKFRQQLEKLFTLVELSPVVWRNLPPAFIYRCTK